ncbi:hypothetical protein [Serratia marcescens]|uniref:hypothetical protein n=1 Tax=Serratia marcescens TaxID=615 RepID=UPI004045C87B
MVRKFNKAALALMVLAGSAGMAHAAGQIGTIDTKSADVAFEQLTGVTHTLTAVETVFDTTLSDTRLLANGQISTIDGVPQLIAIRYTPGTYSGGSGPKVNVMGAIDALNQLTVSLTTAFMDWTADGQWDGYVTTAPQANCPYSIRSGANQTVAPDIYRVSLDAALWSN